MNRVAEAVLVKIEQKVGQFSQFSAVRFFVRARKIVLTKIVPPRIVLVAPLITVCLIISIFSKGCSILYVKGEGLQDIENTPPP